MRKETDKGKIRRKALCLGQKHVGLCAIAGCEKISFANGLFHLLSYLSNAPFRGASLCRGRSKKTLTAQEEGGKCSFRAATPGPHAGDAVPPSPDRSHKQALFLRGFVLLYSAQKTRSCDSKNAADSDYLSLYSTIE